MSLVGNLEDLSLPDILQIVSLSKKSGILVLEQEGLQGKIFIREGKVLQTVSPRSGKTLGEILSGKGLLRSEDLKNALELQKSGGGKELLGAILVEQGLIDQEILEKVVQEQIEEAIVYFLSWKEGTFSFELSSIEGRGEISIDPHAFILEKGIDTQWLVLEGTRMMDERERGGGTPVEETVADAFIEEEPVREEAEESRGGVVLIDDDPIMRDLVRERLTRLGYRVVPCEGAEKGLEAVKEFSRSFPPVVITDIVFPTSDGRGFLGGLEVIEKLRRLQPEIPIVAITSYPDDNVKGKLAGFGVSHFIVKQEGVEVDGEAAKERFFGQLAETLADLQTGEASPEAPAREQEAPDSTEREQLIETIEEKKPLPVEPDLPAAPDVPAAPAAPATPATPASLGRDEFSLLQEMMQELQNPQASSEIGLLILRFASEVLSRAVLFVVKEGHAVGLGGFGVEVPASGRKGGIRGIRIPLDQPSVLEEVVRRRATYRGAVVHTANNLQLMENLGGKTPGEVIAMPLVAGGKVRVILYGDNLSDNQPLPSLQAMEIFLTQAGLTLERVILEKKLQESGQK